MKDAHIAWEEYEKAQKEAFISECKKQRGLAKQAKKEAYEKIKPASGYDIFGYTSKGMYKYYRIMDVPAEVLIDMHKNGAFNKNIPLKKYVEVNVLGLEQCETSNQRFVPCLNKFSYDSESADDKLKEIAKDPRPIKKPCRKYLCEKCGLYHLTSQPGRTSE